MTIQEEIREGIYDLIKKDFIGYWLLKIPTRWLVNKILSYLHSQGVVIKVNGELPVPDWEGWLDKDYTPQSWHKLAQKQMLKAGYVAVEPLIGE